MVGGIAATSQDALAQEVRHYVVTVANATAGQPLAPGLLITHNGAFSLFENNAVASAGLANMAEFGDPSDLDVEVSADGNVNSTVVLEGTGAGAPVALPGETNSIGITTSDTARFFTAVGMLAATNDAFYAARRIRLPVFGKITVHAVAYDAGAEANNEVGDDIQAISGNINDTVGGGEGFIHVHPGVHGGADLDPAVHDWRNPAVEITIERVAGNPND